MDKTCHICKFELDTMLDNCPQCGTDLANPQAETVVLSSDKPTMLTEKRDKETPMVMVLTNLRILMINNEQEEVKPVAGGLIGGAIGGAIAGARAAREAPEGAVKDCVSIPLETVTNLSAKGLGLVKIFFLFTIETTENKTHYAAMHKKIAPEWEAEIQKRIGK